MSPRSTTPRILVSSSLHDAGGLSIDDNGELQGWKDLTPHVSKFSRPNFDLPPDAEHCGAESEGDRCELSLGHHEKFHAARGDDTIAIWWERASENDEG